MILTLLVTAVIFGCAGLIGSLLATLVIPQLPDLADTPAQRDIAAWLPPLLCALFGIGLVVLSATPRQVNIAALAMLPLAAIWRIDAKKGLIPDAFTLGPLALMLVYGVLSRTWLFILVGAAIPFISFALAALFSKGRGMGWGDAKLAALGGALLGAAPALFAFAVACMLAVTLSLLRDRTGKTPIAFGPYLVGAIAVGILYSAHR